MKYKLVLIAFLFLVTNAAIAGKRIPGTYNKGSITLSNGKTIEGIYIWMDYFHPQQFQREITYLHEKGYEKYKKGKNVRKEKETLKLKKVKGFTLENGKKFKKIKYANILVTKTVDMIPKYYLVEVVIDGKITIYKKHYHTRGRVYQGVLDRYNEGGQEFIDWQNNNFELLFQKDKERNPKNIINANLKKLLGDNEEVFSRYKNNEYAFRDEFSKAREWRANINKPYLESLLKLVSDYNNM